MKTCKIFVFLLAAVVALAPLEGCQTPREVAQRKLRKALRIDPTIITTLDNDTAVMRQLRIPYVVKVPAIARESQGYVIDSLLALIRAIPTPGPDRPKSEAYIFSDSTTTISVVKKADGKVAVSFNVKAQTLHDTLYVNDTVRITMPARIVNRDVRAPLWRYWGFWGLILALTLETVLYVRCLTSRKDRIEGEGPDDH